MKNSILVVLIFAFGQMAFGQQTGRVRGQVSDLLTESAIENATVSIVGLDLHTFSNAKGEYLFENVPVGRIELLITSVGFNDINIKELLLASNKELVVNVSMETATNELNEVIVSAASPNLSGAQTSLHAITVEQVMRFPATFFDPARLAFSYPGVANTNDQANGMSIRGNNPRGLQWRLEGVEIVNPNHLSNAGTFSDQATANAGGTNMVSAQMMGNMNFLTGAFPAEYGNALSGVMDMRLRKGNNKEYEHTAQIGLIGIDLATEGPLNKEKGSSYLVNYRYSFTSLLALGGLSFGGETIKFQDLAMNLSFPNEKFGDITIFGMGGVNSNEFAFDDEEGLGPEFEKDNLIIDYYGKMGAAGITHAKKINTNLLWKNALVYSGLRTERSQSVNDPTSSLYLPAQNDISKTSKLAFSSVVTYRSSDNSGLKTGLYLTKTADSLASFQNSLVGDFSSWLVQPFAQYNTSLGNKTNLTFGLHYLNYTLNNSSSLEPRADLGFALSSKSQLNLAYGRHSQLFSSWLYAGNENLKPTLSDQVVLNYDLKLKKGSSITAELYYTTIFNDLSSASQAHLSGINITEYLNPSSLINNGKGRNYGVELNYNKYLDNGFFALINTSLYKSEYLALDGNYYESRYSGNYILNITLGKEWDISKDRVLGVNTRIVWMGGFRNYQIDETKSMEAQRTIFDYNAQLTAQNPDYFRPDLRIYLKRSKAKLNRMWSIDIQNFANYQNTSFDYYDAFQNKVITKYQLGMVPMLNYRWEF
jgi:hypothetical protein